MTDNATIRAGYLPLLDSVLLIVAHEMGFASAQGIALSLFKETSWANIRDRLTVGHFDVAHMLAPMPIAATLALNPINKPMIAPMAMGLGGNAVTVSHALYAQLGDLGLSGGLDAAAAGQALARLIAADLPGRQLKLGVVHPHSGHNYELRYWLAASGIQPDVDVEIVIVPPPLLPDALAEGTIDGFCVGEPWSSVAVDRSGGQILTIKAEIWRSSPEKVLGMTSAWAEDNPEKLQALLRALYYASEWAGHPENHAEIGRVLERPIYLSQPAELIERGLSGRLQLGGGRSADVPRFFIPHDHAATFPWQSHALWFYSQMVRWGHAQHNAANALLAAQVYRPDLYRRALLELGVAVPGANSKVEGSLREPAPVGSSKGSLVLAPDGFFDGATFDPDGLDAYISGQAASNMHNK